MYNQAIKASDAVLFSNVAKVNQLRMSLSSLKAAEH